MNNKILQTSYNRSASNYDQQLAKIQLEKYKIMLGDFSWLPANRILDLGCGTALLFDYLVDAFNSQSLQGMTFDYHGIDFSTRMIQIAKSRELSQLTVGNFVELPYPDHCFDHVFSFTAIGLSDDPISKILTQCYRVIKPGGSLVFTVLKRLDSLITESTLKESGFRVKKTELPCGQDLGFWAEKK